MGDVIWGHNFAPQKSREQTIRTREDAVDHLAQELANMLDAGEALMVFPFAADGGPVVLTCQNGETMTVHSGGPGSSMGGPRVEMPADCPA